MPAVDPAVLGTGRPDYQEVGLEVLDHPVETASRREAGPDLDSCIDLPGDLLSPLPGLLGHPDHHVGRKRRDDAPRVGLGRDRGDQELRAETLGQLRAKGDRIPASIGPVVPDHDLFEQPDLPVT